MTTKIFSFLNTRVARQFETNFREQRPNSSILDFLYRQGSDPSMIACAFTWKDTPEGTKYWKTISILWKWFLKGEGESLSEDLDINSLDTEELRLQERFETVVETRLKFRQLKPIDILQEFAELFGEQVLNLFKQNWKKFSRQYRGGQSLEEFLQKQIECSTVDCMIARSLFIPYLSPEEDKYWRKIDDMWNQYWAVRSVMKVK